MANPERDLNAWLTLGSQPVSLGLEGAMNRYRPARQYLPASVAAFALAAFSIWCGLHWSLALIPAGLFVLSACLLYFLGARPVIEVTRACLYIGVRSIRWSEIESVESTAWNSPLVLRLTMRGGKRARLIYPDSLTALASERARSRT